MEEADPSPPAMTAARWGDGVGGSGLEDGGSGASGLRTGNARNSKSRALPLGGRIRRL